MVDITNQFWGFIIVYKPTYNYGAPPPAILHEIHTGPLVEAMCHMCHDARHVVAVEFMFFPPH